VVVSPFWGLKGEGQAKRNGDKKNETFSPLHSSKNLKRKKNGIHQ
jgi:hypothetical protein